MARSEALLTLKSSEKQPTDQPTFSLVKVATSQEPPACAVSQTPFLPPNKQQTDQTDQITNKAPEFLHREFTTTSVTRSPLQDLYPDSKLEL